MNANSDFGYQATETLAGTRIRSDLKDVGAAITVVTEAFLRDVGATDNTTLLQYTPSAEVAGTRSTYTGAGNSQSISENLTDPSSNTRIRGLSTADNTRDFFVSDIPWDSFNVDRIDVQRGANSMLFGLGKPAGIVNASVRGADFRNRVQFQNRVGSYGSMRNSIDVNQVMIPKQLALRVSGLWDQENFRQKPAFEDDSRIYAALRWDPQLFKNKSLRTSFKAKVESGKIDANRPRTVTPNENISPFFRPSAVSTSNPWGGLAKGTFDAYNVLNTQNIAGDGKGQATGTDPEFNAWISGNSLVQQQQPFYLVDGTTGQLYMASGGIVNRAVRSSTGAVSASSSVAAMPNSFPFISMNSPQSFATALRLPNYQFGQYKQSGLRDPGVFDYNNILIDGPNKWERSKWTAYNLDFSQTAFDDRLGINLIYDRQNFSRGQESFFGTPTLNVDLTSNFQDFAANPNAGRVFLSGSGSGSRYKSTREVARVSLFGEVRATDFLQKSILTKILGHHRFNGVYSGEEFFSESRGYRLTAADSAWYDYRLGATSGATTPFDDRAPVSIVYLGQSLRDRDSLAGINLPGVQVSVLPNDAPLYNFLAEWKNFTVPFNAPYNKAGDPIWGQFPSSGTYTQSGNPANYVGWNRDFTLNLLRAADGDVDAISTSGSKQLRKTESWAGTWQSYWWNDALVGTLGWRYDLVKTKTVQGLRVAANRNLLNLSPDVFRLPDQFDPALTAKVHSLSWGGVLHLNRILNKDRLPINVSLAYNRSSNFEVANRRVDLYGDPLPVPEGKTEDYSLRLSTKDGKYSLRVTRFKSEVSNSTSAGFDTSTIGAIMATGVAWANVFEYNLSGYDMSTVQNPPGGRNTYSPGPGETQDDATRRENAAIAAWRELQAKVNPRLYTAWGMDPSKVYQYTSSAPANFTIPEDAISKGTEYEFTANPTRNWRISANASQTEAIQNNIGGAALIDYVNLISHYMNDTPAGDLRQFSGGPTANTFQNIWNSGFYARWTLKKLQEGAAVPEIRKWRYSATTNYTFHDGWLNNVGVGGSYRWEDKVVIGYPVISSTTGPKYDFTQPYYGPSEDAVDLWVSYERKIAKKVGWRIQLNVRNAFAKDGLIPITVQPDGQTWAQMRVKPNREWFVTNTFTF